VIEQSTDPKHGMMTFATMAPDGNTLGAKGGSQGHTLTLAQLPTGITSVNAAQNITINAPTNNFVTGTPATFSRAAGGSPSVDNVAANASGASGVNSISVTSNNTNGAAHNNVQPAIACNYIIRII
jgi:microcystin-dependent protein